MPIRALREFIQLESSGGVLLLVTALLAMLFDNTPLHGFYQALFALPVGVNVGIFSISKPLLMWINDGLMAVFFLLVGLEIKRELLVGELNSVKKATLPAVAAVGGMLVPAIVYVAINFKDPAALTGWAIPTATDIAFSLGILALLGKRIPVSLKVFLTALAIFDDLGAIIVIAAFYTANISWVMLIVAVALSYLLFVFNRLKVTHLGPYVIVGIALWLCVLKSGVHATLAGIILAWAIPLHNPKNKHDSPLQSLEHKLHPWVAFGVLPIFAFANAGVNFGGLTWAEVTSSITVGITLGLFIGKQIGIWGACWLAIKSGVARMPRGAHFSSIYGVSLVAGVGFTMSLFIGSLAFSGLAASYLDMTRLGVIVGSLLSGVLGYLVLRKAHPLRPRGKKHL